MNTQTLRQRPATTTTPGGTDDRKTIREKKLVRARRGLRSLAVAITLPLILAILSSYLSPPEDETSPAWYPPAWTVHVASATTAGLMGLAAWLVWAAGGMRSPATVAFFAGQLILGMASPVFAGHGRVAGIVIRLAKVAAMAGCGSYFRRVNGFAGNLVIVCIAWEAFMALVGCRMV